MDIVIADRKVRLNKYITWALFVGSGEMFFASDFYIGHLFVFFQIGTILYYFLTGKKTEAICYEIISFSLAEDYDGCYSLKSIEILSINAGFWLLMFLFLFIVTDRQIWQNILKRTGNRVIILIRLFVLINLLAGFWGAFTVFILNDNNVQSLPGIVMTFFNFIYSYIGMTMIPMTILFYGYIKDKEFIVALKQSVTGICTVIIICVVLSLVSGRYVTDIWGRHVSVSPVAYALHCILLFPFYKEYEGIRWWLFGVFGFIIGVIFFPGGKGMIFLVPIALSIFGLCFAEAGRAGQRRMIQMMFLGVIVIFGGVAWIVAGGDLPRNVLSKKDYALGLLNIFDKGWFDLVPPSPKFRIVELINIVNEFIKKPYFILFGKGFAGTVPDSVGWLGTLAPSTSAAGMDEWNSGLFYSMHETVNKLFLTNGFIGLSFIFWTVREMIKNYKCSPFLLLGAFWFLFFWGYCIQLAIFGTAALFIGFAEIESTRSGRNLNVKLRREA